MTRRLESSTNGGRPWGVRARRLLIGTGLLAVVTYVVFFWRPRGDPPEKPEASGDVAQRTSDAKPAAVTPSDRQIPAHQATATEATGNKPNVAAPIADASGQEAGEPAADDKAVVPVCAPAPSLDVDARTDGWDTEVYGETAGQRLGALGKLLSAPEKITTDNLASYVADGLETMPLAAGELAEVYRDGTFVVSRPKLKTSIAKRLSGAAGLVDALRSLAALAPQGSEIHTKFKVFRVEKNAAGLSTSAYFQMGGKTATGSVQVNSTWLCEWSLDESASAAGAPSMKLRSIVIENYEQTIGLMSKGMMFADCTDAILSQNASYQDQLRYSVDHWLGRIEMSVGIDVGGWEGLAVGDVNGDGLDDVYACQPGGLPNRLYVANADGTADDKSAESGVDFLDATSSALFVDFDNDGDQDLVLGMTRGVLFLANDGSGKFTERTPNIGRAPRFGAAGAERPAVRAAKFLPDAAPYSLVAADYDRDGDVDLFVCGYRKRPGRGEVQEGWARPVPYHDANNGGRNTLLRNDGAMPDGSWKFTYATVEAGLDENNRRFSYAAAWEDFDNDGDLDLYVANDFGRDNLYQNDGHGHFRDISPRAGVDDISPGMSASWGDVNNDGWMDLYVSNMFSSAGNRVSHQDKFLKSFAAGTKSEFQRHARGNTLFQNNRDGTFTDTSESAGVTLGRWAWSSKLVDINNDGWEDILVTNGFVTQENPDDL